MPRSGLVVPEDRAVRLWVGFGATTAVLLALSAVLARGSASVAEFDQDVMAFMSAVRQPALTAAAQIVTGLGSLWPVTLFSIVVALVVGYRAQRLLEPAVMLAAVEVCAQLVQLVKTVIGRARPPLEGMLGAPVFDYSFPSDHTACGTVVYVLGALLLTVTETQNCRGRLLLAAGCVMGGLIGLSRVYLGYHWLTDVVGGWLLAAFVTSIGMVFITASRRPGLDPARHAVAPPDAFARITRLLIGNESAATVGISGRRQG
jgi:membrane-associated phospholipid phosphatase